MNPIIPLFPNLTNFDRPQYSDNPNYLDFMGLKDIFQQRAQTYSMLFLQMKNIYYGATDVMLFNCDSEVNNSTFEKIIRRAKDKIMKS